MPNIDFVPLKLRWLRGYRTVLANIAKLEADGLKLLKHPESTSEQLQEAGRMLRDVEERKAVVQAKALSKGYLNSRFF